MFDYIKIEGFRSFKKVELEMPRLAVLIGPNGGGKSNFLDLLALMAEAGNGQLANGIIKRGGFANIAFGFDASQEVSVEFHFRELRRQVCETLPPPPSDVSDMQPFDILYRVGLRGWGVGFRVWSERARVKPPDETSFSYGGGSKMIVNTMVNTDAGGTVFRSSKGGVPQVEERKSIADLELAIFQVRDPDKYKEPWAVLQQLQGMAFYRDIDMGPEARVRQPALIRPDVSLVPDGSNLSSVVYSIQEGHPKLWSEILEDLHTAYPDFVKLTVRAGGGDGKVHLRWFERPYEKEGMSANLLSDGTLKLLCLIAILKNPDPPSLICIDEPELGLHPDWIELVAELLQDAATRTQVIVATHSPQLVAKLEPEQVIVTEKVDGETHLTQLKSRDLENWLKDFSLAELWLSGEIGGRP
jgi:predicted ATPase